MLSKLASITTFLIALSTATPVASAEAGTQLQARSSIPFVMSIYNAYPCDSSTAREQVSITSGQCHNINFAGWGADAFNPNVNQNCVLKFWDTTGCTGKATTWFMPGGTSGNKCFASARQAGINQFGAGAKSVIANCAFDVVPQA